LIRKGIRQQLQYLRRNFKYIEQMLDTLMPDAGMDFPLKHKLQRQYWIIQQLYAQLPGRLRLLILRYALRACLR